MPTLSDLVAIMLSLLVALGIIGLVLLVLAILMTIIALFRDALVGFVAAILDLIAVFGVVPARAIHRFLPPISGCIGAALSSLAYSSRHTPPLPQAASWAGWTIIGPLVYLGVFAFISAGDFYFSALGFAALFGSRPSLPRLPLNLENAAAMLFVLLGVIFGFIALDLWEGTPIHRPWSNLSPAVARFLRWLVFVCIVATIAAGVSFTVWRQLQLSDHPLEPFNTILPMVIWIFLAALLVIASGLAGWSAFICLGAYYAIVLLIVRAVLWTLLVPCYLLVHVLRAALQIAVCFIDLFAGRGQAVWNWLAALPIFALVRLQPIIFGPQPTVGQDIGQPLFYSRREDSHRMPRSVTNEPCSRIASAHLVVALCRCCLYDECFSRPTRPRAAAFTPADTSDSRARVIHEPGRGISVSCRLVPHSRLPLRPPRRMHDVRLLGKCSRDSR